MLWAWNVYWFTSGILCAWAYYRSEMKDEVTEWGMHLFLLLLAFFFGFVIYPIVLAVRWHTHRAKTEEEKELERVYYRALG